MGAGDPRIDVVVGADVKPFAAGMASAMGGLRQFIAAGTLLSLAKHSIDLGGALQDASKKASVSVAWLQEVGFAAAQAGSSTEELTNAVFELRRAQAQALGGSKGDASAFATLGITVAQLKTQGAEQLFDRIASAVNKSGGGIREVNAATQILGRGGKGLIAGMVDGFDDARAAAQKYGLVISDLALAKLDTLGDRIDAVKLKIMAMTAETLASALSIANWSGLLDSTLNIGKTTRESWIAMATGQGIPGVLRAILQGAGRQSAIVDKTAEGMASEDAAFGGSGKKAAPGAEPVSLGKGRGSSIHVDELTRIGGFIGAQVGSQGVGIARQQLQVLREIRSAVRSQNDTTKGLI